MPGDKLRAQIAQVMTDAGAESVAVAYHDYETRTEWSYNGDEWFHSASTMKVAVLIAVFGAVAEGRFQLESRVHVRNRFLSIADGQPYQIESARDSNGLVHARIGRTMRVRDLARHMIVTSSNLATNLLIARVDPHLCVSCGICAGSCAPMGVGPDPESARMPDPPLAGRATARSAPERANSGLSIWETAWTRANAEPGPPRC